MALTMTRTRTQTTLTKLAELVAAVHGELAFLEGLLEREVAGVAESKGSTPEMHARLVARRFQLARNQDALYATVRQFDPELNPENIGTSDEWARQYGSRQLKAKGLVRRYRAQLP